MELNVNETELLRASIAYLKRQYDEDTVNMVVRKNDVLNGNGVLEVDCTVSINGTHSDWTKWFSFRNGAVTGMRWESR
jgi:ABC-type sulfate transport system substrate-binding protein